MNSKCLVITGLVLMNIKFIFHYLCPFSKTAKYNNPSSSCSCPTPREPCLFPCCRWLFRFSFSIHVFIFSLHRALLLNTCFHLITSSASFLDHFDEKRFSLNTIFMFSLRQHLSLTILINTIPTA